MPEIPYLTLVDLLAQRRGRRRQRVLSTVVGMLVAAAGAVPFLLTVGH
jgi:hypothetical protein